MIMMMMMMMMMMLVLILVMMKLDDAVDDGDEAGVSTSPFA